MTTALPMPSHERRVGKLTLPANLRVTCDRCGSEVTFDRGEMVCLDCPISFTPVAGIYSGPKGGKAVYGDE